MTIEMLISLLGAVGLILSGAWVLLRMAMNQFDLRLSERFEAIEKLRTEARRVAGQRMEALESKYERLDIDVRRILIDMPREYVSRTDYIRRETVIEGKIDMLSLRIENWILESKK